MGGLTPGLGQERDPLITWVTFRFGERYGRCSRAVARGIEMHALDGVSTRSLTGFGCESLYRGQLHLDSRWGLPRESILGSVHW
jgi:hypothetical protein